MVKPQRAKAKRVREASRSAFEQWWRRKNDVPSQFKQGAASKEWAWEGWKAERRYFARYAQKVARGGQG